MSFLKVNSLMQDNKKGDLHHLRACDKDVNSARGNLPFTQGSGRARKVGGGWYPSDEFKGECSPYGNVHESTLQLTLG